LMWMVAKPFHEGRPAPRQESIEHELRVPGEVTRNVSDKLIRAKLLTLAGNQGDCLHPARSLERISVGDVLKAVRNDEDNVVARLPALLPKSLFGRSTKGDELTFAELLAGEDRQSPLAP
jgi:membrane protein